MTLLKTASLAARIASALMAGILFLFIGALFIPYFDNASSFKIIRLVLSLEQTILDAVKNNVPTTFGGKDVSRWIVVVGSIILSAWFSNIGRKINERSEYIQFKNHLDDWKQKIHLSNHAIVLSPLNQKLELLKTAKKKDREKLLSEFAEMKKKLDEMGKDLTFLSIDVVDSSHMKEEEDRSAVEHDFKEYRRFVEATFAAHGCLKSAWTSEGVLSSFTSVDAAVRAAREVINGLDQFNRTVKNMRRDFNVRCGVNSGFVYLDDSLPLEEISDRVIDIASHMQKHAQPNSLCVPKPAIEPLNERNGFEPSGQLVDGYEVYVWTKG